MKLTFWGAAQTVTGSMHEVRSGGDIVLLDCGLYQGRRKEAFSRNRDLPFRGDRVRAVVLSHAHIDHSGNLPNLVRNGFSGPIFATPATSDLCEAMLMDSAFLQEKDAEFLNRRAERRRSIGVDAATEPIEPLYTHENVEQTLPLFHSVLPHCLQKVTDTLTMESREAGHMLGSTSVVLTDGRVRLGFSGDIGRVGLPIIHDPEPLPPVDYLIMESTYGDRFHEDPGNVREKLAEVITRTAKRGGKIVAPSFAVGRAQQLVLLIHELIRDRRIPPIPIFVDSPLAINTTEVFRRHMYLYDEDTRKFLREGVDPFGFSRLTYVREAAQSKALNDLRGPFLVISASGMCEAGRILHHLRNTITDPRNTVLITGFQAEHTLGRKIVERREEVPIFGELYPLRAEVDVINELSGHADQRELLEWLKPIAPGLKRIFLAHGELKQQQALKLAIEERYGLDVVIPSRGEEFELG